MTKDTKLHDQLKKEGFVVIKGLISPEEVEKYREISEKLVDKARAGDWPHVRTRGKQFPPWPKTFTPDIWGVSGLLHPALGPEISEAYQALYAHPNLLAAASDILQVEEDELVMELLNMLINPLTDFDLDWHRDDVKPEVTPEVEIEQLKYPVPAAQFNLALYTDDCLIAVPGTHVRVRTPEEREVSINDRTGYISGQQVVVLEPGDCVFYNNNILHRASYKAANKRITVHGSYGHPRDGKLRANNILQHGVAEWLPDFKPADPKLQKLKQGLEKIVEENKGKPIVYSLDG